MRFNRAYLNFLIEDRGMTIEELYKKIGISGAAWYRRMKDENHFTYKDIKKIIEVLSLTSEEKEIVFFK